MAFCTIGWFSHSLGKQVQMNVILPDTGKGPFPVFYLLHGLTDDYTCWHRRSRIEVYVADKPLIVVMPDGYRGWYTNNVVGARYFDYMTKDLIETTERFFPAKRTRAGRCIGGLSMGGYGALRIALGRPDLFCSVNSHSGALWRGSNNKHLQNPEFERRLGKKRVGTDNDLLHLAKQAKKAGTLPKMLIDCGTEDYLLEENRIYHRELEEAGIDHIYREFPGAHTWDYWDEHVKEALEFHCRNLRIK